jgi:hypothetical protein
MVKHVDAAELRIDIAAVLAAAAGAFLAALHLLKHGGNWLPHRPACMCKISREEAAWRR